MSEKELQVLSAAKLADAVRSFGAQKVLARDVNMSDAELSRLLHEQAPKLIKVLTVLGLAVVDADHVASLRAVLKAVL